MDVEADVGPVKDFVAGTNLVVLWSAPPRVDRVRLRI